MRYEGERDTTEEQTSKEKAAPAQAVKEPIRTKVLNLSKRTLTQQQVKLLTRGPKFCVSTPGNFFDYKSSTREFTRRIVLQELFFDKPNEDHSLVRQASKKHISTKNNDLKNICNALNRVEPSRIEAVSNISREEKEAL